MRRSWSLFDIFGPRRSPRYDRRHASRRARRPRVKQRKPKSRVARQAAPATPEIAAVEKLPDAKRCPGDRRFPGQRPGRRPDRQPLRRTPTVRVLDRIERLVGLCARRCLRLADGDRHTDRRGKAGRDRHHARLQRPPADAVDGKREAPNSEAWIDAYEARTEALADGHRGRTRSRSSGSAMPPFKSSKMSSDMLAFNDIYQTAADERRRRIRRHLGRVRRRERRLRRRPVPTSTASRCGCAPATASTSPRPASASSPSMPKSRCASCSAWQHRTARPSARASNQPSRHRRRRRQSVDRTEPIGAERSRLDGGTRTARRHDCAKAAATRLGGWRQAAAPAGRAGRFRWQAPRRRLPLSHRKIEADIRPPDVDRFCCSRSQSLTAAGRVDPISASSIARAAWRPSRIAQTTSDWPRRTSPAA